MCLPVSEVQKSFRVDDSLQIMKRERDSTFALIRLQQKFLASKDSTIRDLRFANSSALNVISLKQQSIDNALRQRDLQRADMEYFKRMYKRQRRATFTAALAGAIVIFIVGKAK